MTGVILDEGQTHSLEHSSILKSVEFKLSLTWKYFCLPYLIFHWTSIKWIFHVGHEIQSVLLVKFELYPHKTEEGDSMSQAPRRASGGW